MGLTTVQRDCAACDKKTLHYTIEGFWFSACGCGVDTGSTTNSSTSARQAAKIGPSIRLISETATYLVS